MADDLYPKWWNPETTQHGPHLVTLVRERKGGRDATLPKLRDVVASHYVDPRTTADRLTALGAKKTARLFREALPVIATARAGDLGEILATEYAVRRLGFKVPVYRLRWKDGRNMALRGDDLIGYADDQKVLVFLKGEVKSRKDLASTVVTEALAALDRGRGRPTRHSVLFVAHRLRDRGDEKTALLFEKLLTDGSSRRYGFGHYVFTMSGNTPDAHLTGAAASRAPARPTVFVGFEVPDYSDFIQRIYEFLKCLRP